MSEIPQAEWDSLRLDILAEAADSGIIDNTDPDVRAMLVALTQAFDRPVPVYSVYRQLSSFKFAQWPLLRNIVSQADLSVGKQDLRETLHLAGRVLHATCEQRDRINRDALEVELEVLNKLLRKSR